MKVRLSTIALLIIFFLPPLVGIIENRLDPNTATALGVPLLAMLGLGAGLIATLVFSLVGRYWPVWKPTLTVAGTAFVISAVLVLIADRGWISIVS